MKKKPATAAGTSADQRCTANQFEQYRGRMIAPKECAKELGMSEFTIHRWIHEGKIQAVKLTARCTRIDGNSLADYMVENVFVPGKKEAKPENLRAKCNRKGAAHSASEIAGQA